MFGNNEIEEWKSGITILMRKILKKNLDVSSGNKDRSKIVHAQSEFSERVKSVYLERKKRNVNQ